MNTGVTSVISSSPDSNFRIRDELYQPSTIENIEEQIDDLNSSINCRFFIEKLQGKEDYTLNKKKLYFTSKQFIDWVAIETEIFASLDWNDLKTGEINELENIIFDLTRTSSYEQILDHLSKMFVKFNDNALFVCTLLHTLSHLDYEDVYPYGPAIAMASLNHKDDRVIGFAIKAFSNWNAKGAIPYMKSNVPHILWAKKEWDRVIEYINEYGDEDNELLDKNDRPNEGMGTRTRGNNWTGSDLCRCYQ